MYRQHEFSVENSRKTGLRVAADKIKHGGEEIVCGEGSIKRSEEGCAEKLPRLLISAQQEHKVPRVYTGFGGVPRAFLTFNSLRDLISSTYGAVKASRNFIVERQDRITF